MLRELDGSTDGRTDRAIRTRRAVVDALLSLIESGELRPTAKRIAEHAGVGLRSVFQHFDDLDAIYLAVAQRQLERFGHLIDTGPASGPLRDRLGSFVERRAELLDGISPVRRAAIIGERFSPALADSLRWAREMFRDDVAAAFSPELEGRTTRGRRRELLAALDATTSWETWETLRRHNGLSVDAATRTLKDMLAALCDRGRGNQR